MYPVIVRPPVTCPARVNVGDTSTFTKRPRASYHGDSPCQGTHLTRCSRKVRMSGLSKIEMSAFMGWGAHGDGAYRLEPARTGSTEGVARGKAEAFDASGGRRAPEGNRPSGPAAAFGA